MLSAGLPNITGSMMWHGVSVEWDDSGALYRESRGTGYTWDANRYYGTDVYFDASRSNPIYGNSETIQPPSIGLIPQIKF